MAKISIEQLEKQTGVRFGTSGIRNLEKVLTDRVCYAYTRAFISFLKEVSDLENKQIAIAGDLRKSTDRIMYAVAKAISDCGLEVVYCGKIPTPAVTYFGIKNDIPSIMITGSHIPKGRNGIKYNLSEREILKSDESLISKQVVEIDEEIFDKKGSLTEDDQIKMLNRYKEAHELFVERYINFFDDNFLEGKEIGIYGHSAVGREMLEIIIRKLGATVHRLGFSETFVPVDTEAVEEETIKLGKKWQETHNLFSILTTDGDSDRPLMSDEEGNWLRSDTLGIPTAEYLKADAVVLPISCNTAVDKSGLFDEIRRVKVGSPYVVAEMEKLKNEGYKRVVGYEANGGFLINSNIDLNGNILEKLPTRDSFIVLLANLKVAIEKDIPVSKLMEPYPKRYTASSSVKNFATEKSLRILVKLQDDREKLQNELKDIGKIESVNTLDGLRVTFDSKDVVHFRPSRNAPEFRNYTEADSQKRAEELSGIAFKIIEKWR